MKTRSILLVAWMAVALASSVRGQFVPGHVFVAESAGKLCMQQEIYGHDRIWEIDPETGEGTLFVEIPDEMCGFLTGLAFTPDGTRLRAASWTQSWILEFDSDGKMTIALDSSDGIACPWGFNNLAYDAQRNFYVVNECSRNILRFPADGGPPTVFADAADGVTNGGAIAFAADGDLYLTSHPGFFEVVRITPDGNASVFDNFGSFTALRTVAADQSGHVYVALDSGEIFRYDAGDPGSKELLALVPCSIRCSMTMSPDQSTIYLNRFGTLLGIKVVDGTVATLGAVPPGMFLGAGAGIAVVPIPPPPIPTVSGWGVIVMTLLLLTEGTLVFIRRLANKPCQGEKL